MRAKPRGGSSVRARRLSGSAEARRVHVGVNEVSKAYGEGIRRALVLDRVSMTVDRGTSASLVGPSGSGKSTLLALIAGLTTPNGGQILLGGTDVTALDERERTQLRSQRIGVVMQRGGLLPFLSATENVELALTLAGVRRRRSERARALLSELGLGARVDHRPAHLSGGEVRRVALAMALAKGPELLLADEMTGELDAANAAAVMRLVLRESRERGLTLLFATHSTMLAGLAQRRFILDTGCVTPT